jgi:hypothetical protein
MQYRCWRRKAGVVTLVMACVFTAGWVRSMVTDDYVSAFNRTFYSSKGAFLIGGHFSLDYRTSAWDSRPGLFPPEMRFSGVPYSLMAIPLTLLSAYLILWKPRKREVRPPQS